MCPRRWSLPLVSARPCSLTLQVSIKTWPYKKGIAGEEKKLKNRRYKTYEYISFNFFVGYLFIVCKSAFKFMSDWVWTGPDFIRCKFHLNIQAFTNNIFKLSGVIGKPLFLTSSIEIIYKSVPVFWYLLLILLLFTFFKFSIKTVLDFV